MTQTVTFVQLLQLSLQGCQFVLVHSAIKKQRFISVHCAVCANVTGVFFFFKKKVKQVSHASHNSYCSLIST